MLKPVCNCSLHSNSIMQTKEKVHRFLVVSGTVADAAEKWQFFTLNCCIIHVTSLLKALFYVYYFVVS